MATPTLDIDGMKFELEDGFSDGYTNQLRPAAEMKGVTHPYKYLWWRGEFKPLRIVLNLAVGVQSLLTTPEHLKSVCGAFFKMALSQSSQGEELMPKKVSLSVGSWYKRMGYIRNLDIDYNPPWSQQGLPMTAKITFEFVLDFGEDPAKLPNSETFSYVK